MLKCLVAVVLLLASCTSVVDHESRSCDYYNTGAVGNDNVVSFEAGVFATGAIAYYQYDYKMNTVVITSEDEWDFENGRVVSVLDKKYLTKVYYSLYLWRNLE